MLSLHSCAVALAIFLSLFIEPRSVQKTCKFYQKSVNKKYKKYSVPISVKLYIGLERFYFCSLTSLLLGMAADIGTLYSSSQR